MVNSTLHVPPCKYKKWQIMVDLLHSNSTGPVSFELKLTFTKAKKKKKKKKKKTLILCNVFCLSLTSYAWILQDILGISFCISLMRVIRLPSLKVCTLLLVLLLIYDAFFVYITPLFSAGKSIMVEVATGKCFCYLVWNLSTSGWVG